MRDLNSDFRCLHRSKHDCLFEHERSETGGHESDETRVTAIQTVTDSPDS